MTESVILAMDRAAAKAHRQMKRGVNSLATVAATAPLFGLWLTVYSMVTSFKAVNGEKSAIFARYTYNLGDALIPAAFGLAIGIFASTGFRYCRNSLSDFAAEMRHAACLIDLLHPQNLVRRDTSQHLDGSARPLDLD